MIPENQGTVQIRKYYLINIGDKYENIERWTIVLDNLYVSLPLKHVLPRRPQSSQIKSRVMCRSKRPISLQKQQTVYNYFTLLQLLDVFFFLKTLTTCIQSIQLVSFKVYFTLVFILVLTEWKHVGALCLCLLLRDVILGTIMTLSV